MMQVFFCIFKKLCIKSLTITIAMYMISVKSLLYGNLIQFFFKYVMYYALCKKRFETPEVT